MYVSRKERERGRAIIQDIVDASIQRIEKYIKRAHMRIEYSDQKE